jgi:hypothetical protein
MFKVYHNREEKILIKHAKIAEISRDTFSIMHFFISHKPVTQYPAKDKTSQSYSSLLKLGIA